MKKIFTLVLLLASLHTFGQGIVLKYNHIALGDNDTIDVVPRYSNADDVFYLDIFNTTSQNLGVMVQRQKVSLVNGATSVFCVGDACLDGDASIFPENILAGDSLTHSADGDRSFHIFYNPNGTSGVSLLKFTFFDETTTTITKSVFFRINHEVSVNEAKENTVLTAYPNPATSRVTFEHVLNSNIIGAQLIIRNITGVSVYNSPIGNSSKSNISLEGFTPGIYFYSIEVNNKSIITKKLIIK